MNFQNIIQNILTNPIFIIMMIGGFSALGRGIKAAQEKKAQKKQLQQLRESQRDSLRTGQRPDAAKAASADIAEPSPATWDQKQELRRQRIEKLRQQRIDQLNKIRQKRSASQASSSPTNQSQSQSQRQTQNKPKPIQQTSQQSRQPAQQSQRYSQQAQSTSRTPQQPILQQTTPAPRRRSRPTVLPAAIKSSPAARSTSQSAFGLGNTLDNDSTIKSGSIANNSTNTLGSRAFLTKNLRQAILAKEILSPPIAMRAPDADATTIQ
jgi:hypothetical protein